MSEKGKSQEVVLVDPSLFTPAYDAGLNGGLRAVGFSTLWITRALRDREDVELPAEDRSAFFYRYCDKLPGSFGRLRGLAKGVEHLIGLVRLIRLVSQRRPAAVHVQWAVLPLFDALAIRWIKRICPVVMTVHDTVPFNGERISLLQNAGFDWPIAAADAVIVHTEHARGTLIARGIAGDRVFVVPHGPFSLAKVARPPSGPREPRWTFVLFGQLKPYKGLDVLIEAVGAMPEAARAKSRFIIAGAAHMPLEPLRERVRALALEEAIEFRIGRLDEQEMADLFAEADAFVCPYRQIDASGVYFLLKPLRKWLIASRVGIFAEDIESGSNGMLVSPGDPAALASALADAAERRPVPLEAQAGQNWAQIALLTKGIYDAATVARSLTSRRTLG